MTGDVTGQSFHDIDPLSGRHQTVIEMRDDLKIKSLGRSQSGVVTRYVRLYRIPLLSAANEESVHIGLEEGTYPRALQHFRFDGASVPHQSTPDRIEERHLGELSGGARDRGRPLAEKAAAIEWPKIRLRRAESQGGIDDTHPAGVVDEALLEHLVTARTEAHPQHITWIVGTERRGRIGEIVECVRRAHDMFWLTGAGRAVTMSTDVETNAAQTSLCPLASKEDPQAIESDMRVKAAGDEKDRRSGNSVSGFGFDAEKPAGAKSEGPLLQRYSIVDRDGTRDVGRDAHRGVSRIERRINPGHDRVDGRQGDLLVDGIGLNERILANRLLDVDMAMRKGLRKWLGQSTVGSGQDEGVPHAWTINPVLKSTKVFHGLCTEHESRYLHAPAVSIYV